MEEKKKPWLRNLEFSIVKALFIAPWYVIAFIFRLLYGFHIENPEKLPTQGPFILALKEPSIAGIFSTGYMILKVLLPQSSKVPPPPFEAYMQEKLFEMNYINYANAVLKRYGWKGELRGLIPHSAGLMALGLFDGLRTLNKGGIVVLNPEGNSRWDGLPMPIGHSLAWIGLHSAAPIYPALCTQGAFEIWPTWRGRPYPTGKIFVRVGEPFKLTESPMDQITDADLKAASDRIHEIYEIGGYGEGGVKAWVGPIRRNGEVKEGPVKVKKPQKLISKDQWSFNYKNVKITKRGVALLLWRCPVCKTNDALVHQDSWVRKRSVHCQACRTKWEFKRIPGHDFRMAVIEGDAELVGLDMPVSAWYEKMKEGFAPEPIPITDEGLEKDELVYLENDNVSLMVSPPSHLSDDWEDGEAPASKPRGGSQYAKWESIGEGKLLMTEQRLVWRDQVRELYFNWSSVIAVHNWTPNTLGITYGSARYQIPLGSEAGLKWLTYMGAFVKKAADQDGHKYRLSPY